jgi:hypothetical protein
VAATSDGFGWLVGKDAPNVAQEHRRRPRAARLFYHLEP